MTVTLPLVAAVGIVSPICVDVADAGEAFATLSDQELRILSLLAKGKTNKEIADSIFLSEKTVRNYVSSILSKLSLSTRAEAAAYAVQHRVQDHMPTD